jgi:hypothetical protein
MLLFHHDPLHDDDMLDTFGEEAARVWSERGGSPERLTLARERSSFTVSAVTTA